MSDRADLQRRAIQQSQTGNYWAGKCVGLIDALNTTEAIVGRFRDGWRIVRVPSCRPDWRKRSADGSVDNIQQMSDAEVALAFRHGWVESVAWFDADERMRDALRGAQADAIELLRDES